MFGDPHINTIDGLAYTFNGLGEFTLINTMNSTFTLQGRTMRTITNGTLMDSTIFTAAAAKDSDSDNVNVMLNSTYDGLFYNTTVYKYNKHNDMLGFRIFLQGVEKTSWFELAAINDTTTGINVDIEKSSDKELTVAFGSG